MNEESPKKSLTHRPDVGLNDQCQDLVARAVREYKNDDPFFVRQWVFENVVLEAYQLGITRANNLKDKSNLSRKEAASFLYQANLKHIRDLTKSELEKHGINIISDHIQIILPKND